MRLEWLTNSEWNISVFEWATNLPEAFSKICTDDLKWIFFLIIVNLQFKWEMVSYFHNKKYFQNQTCFLGLLCTALNVCVADTFFKSFRFSRNINILIYILLEHSQYKNDEAQLENFLILKLPPFFIHHRIGERKRRRFQMKKFFNRVASFLYWLYSKMKKNWLEKKLKQFIFVPRPCIEYIFLRELTLGMRGGILFAFWERELRFV